MRTTRCALGLLLALVVSGCTGSTTETVAEQRFTSSELARFVAVRPPADGWRWPSHGEAHDPLTRRELEALEPPQHAIQRALLDTQKDAGFVERRARSWQTEAETGRVFAELYESAEGAHRVLVGADDFTHRWYTEVDRAGIRDIDVGELGDDAWGVRTGIPRSGSVQLGWRSGNVVFAIYLSCQSMCPTDIGDAAIEWAKALDPAADAPP